MENIFIRFYQKKDLIEWVIPQKDNILYHGTLKELAIECVNRYVIVLLPGSLVSYHQIELPNLSKDKLYKALPFALEDKLAEDISKLHFAVDVVSKGKNRIAVINIQIFKEYLDKLKQENINPDIIVSDDEFIEQLAIQHKNKNIILIDKSSDLIHVASKDGSVLNFSTDLLSNYLDILKSKEIFGDLDVEWILYKCSLGEDLAKAISAQLNVITPEEISNDSIIFFSEEWKNIKRPINLLQGDFKKSNKNYSNKILLTLNLIIMSFLLIIPLIGKIIIYTKYKNNFEIIDNAIKVEYKKIFPNDKDFVEPKIKISREIKKLEKNQISISDFEKIINDFATKYSSFNNILVKKMIYQNKKLTVDVEAPNFAELDKFYQQLKTIQGIKTTEDMLSSQGEIFSGKINMSLN